MFVGGTVGVPDSIMNYAMQDFNKGPGTYTHNVDGALNMIKRVASSGKIPVGSLALNGLPFLQVFSVGTQYNDGVINYIIGAIIAFPQGSFKLLFSAADSAPNGLVVVVAAV